MVLSIYKYFYDKANNVSTLLILPEIFNTRFQSSGDFKCKIFFDFLCFEY